MKFLFFIVVLGVMTSGMVAVALTAERTLLYKILKRNRCPVGYIPHSFPWFAPPPNLRYPHKCFRLVMKPANWYSAYAACHDDGGHLAVISNPFAYGRVKYMINHRFQYFGTASSARFWIGGIDRLKKNRWVWEKTNSLLNRWTPWASGEPSSSSWKRCLEVSNTKFYAQYCNYRRPFICERDL